MHDFFDKLHFIRPAWFWLLPLVGLLWFVLRHRADSLRPWRQIIAPHLLEHLIVRGESRWKFRPAHLIVLVLLLGMLALAGPTWQREPSPFAEETAPLVIALDLSQSMNAVDVQPTRLDRARYKILTLLKLREGSRSALIVYAGTAHSVLPLSDDPSLISEFMGSLRTDLMPVAGKNAASALALASDMLYSESVPGSILFVTDGIAGEFSGAFSEYGEKSHDAILVLAVGTAGGGALRVDDEYVRGPDGERLTAALDIAGLRTLQDTAGISVTGVTADDSDLRSIQRRIESHLEVAQQQDESARWKDDGYALTPLIALLVLLWFRKGWTVRWGGAIAIVFGVGGCGNAESPISALLLSADQRGQQQFETGQYAAAANTFENAEWRGAAYYRAGNFDAAIDSLVLAGTIDAEFNIGNAYAASGRFAEAAASYRSVLERRPAWPPAEGNLALVDELLNVAEGEEESSTPPGDPNQAADEYEFDEKGKQAKAGEIDEEQMSDEQMADMWMRRLQTTPADFLRFRFAAEAAARPEESVE